MKLEEQVTNLELSKELKELGIKQESLFDWVEIDENEFILMARKDISKTEDGCISAFTVSELGELLQLDKTEWLVCSIDPVSKEFVIDYMKHIVKSDTEANARAKMLIYLIENKLIESQNGGSKK